MYFGECAQELYELHRTSRRTAGYHPYLVDIPTVRTKRFATSFIMRTAKEWNSLPASVFPSAYNPNLFKARVNRHLLGELAPSSAPSLPFGLIEVKSKPIFNKKKVRIRTAA